MIRNDREFQAAMKWIEYWRGNRSGEQSWIGNEQARQHIAELRKAVDAYRQRIGAEAPASASASPQRQPEASTHTVNRVLVPHLEG